MATKKITLNELRSLVKNIIKEETSKNKVIKEAVFFDYILQGADATEENAYDAARGLDWQEIETEEGNYPYLQYVDTVNGVGIHYNYGSDNYYFTDETMNESQLNEISSDTFKSAVDKSNKAGSDKRTDRLSKLYFNEFIGYKVLDGRIKEITAFTNDIGILVNMDNEKDKTLYYDYTKDHFSGDDRPMDRKSAVVFSKIFKKINPDTKYKSVGSAFKLSDNFNESKTIKLSEVRQLVRSVIKEESGIPLKDKIINYLKSIYGSEFDEFAAEIALYWYGYGYHEGQFSDGYKILSTSKFKPSRLSNGIEDEDDIAQMYYNDIISEFDGETMNESVKPKSQKIKLSEVRQLVRNIIKESK